MKIIRGHQFDSDYGYWCRTRTRTANLLITNQLVQTYLLLLSLILKDTGVIGQEDYLTDCTLTTNQRQ